MRVPLFVAAALVALLLGSTGVQRKASRYVNQIAQWWAPSPALFTTYPVPVAAAGLTVAEVMAAGRPALVPQSPSSRWPAMKAWTPATLAAKVTPFRFS